MGVDEFFPVDKKSIKKRKIKIVKGGNGGKTYMDFGKTTGLGAKDGRVASSYGLGQVGQPQNLECS